VVVVRGDSDNLVAQFGVRTTNESQYIFRQNIFSTFLLANDNFCFQFDGLRLAGVAYFVTGFGDFIQFFAHNRPCYIGRNVAIIGIFTRRISVAQYKIGFGQLISKLRGIDTHIRLYNEECFDAILAGCFQF